MGRDVCSVVACGKRAEDGSQLHHIPNDPILADMYKRFLQAANKNYIGWKPTVRMCVCDDHFHSENFVMTGKERKLKRGKYPTLASGIDFSAKMVCDSGVDKQMQVRTSSQTFACGLVLEPSHINILANQFQADKPTVKSKAAFTIQTIKPNSNCNSIGIGSFQEQIFMLKEENEQLKKERALDQIQYGKERIENERLKTQILHLQAKFQLIQKEIHVHRQNRRRIEKRQQERKRKREDDEAIETELKRRVLKISVATQTECQQLSQVEALFHNLMERKINNKNFPYTKLLREFSFVLHYFSPAAYKHVRRNLDNLLPHPCQFVRWTDFFKASPGTKLQELLRVSIIQIYNHPA
ncbi:DNA transposase THAP9 [Orchesella cincta]|uniref:DNA transposase THAP9 n=1 Tax=Orchesella cincta TaxID=48709 RepID=A0A1D2N3R6_ORCCI|nr:DNA transposase THAP9 [Orchesella cincta]